MIIDIINKLESAKTEITHTDFNAYECQCLFEYIEMLNNLVNNQAQVIKELTLKENKRDIR